MGLSLVNGDHSPCPLMENPEMKKLIILAATCAALTGFGCDITPVGEIEQAASVFTPTEGLYDRTGATAIGDENSNIRCKFGDVDEFIPAHRLSAVPGGFTLTGVIEIPGQDMDFQIADCSFNGAGHGFTCEAPEQVTSFAPFFDAVITVGAESYHGAFTKKDRYQFTSAPAATFDCEGSECDIVASFFGPEFEFSCGGAAWGVKYGLR